MGRKEGKCGGEKRDPCALSFCVHDREKQRKLHKKREKRPFPLYAQLASHRRTRKKRKKGEARAGALSTLYPYPPGRRELSETNERGGESCSSLPLYFYKPGRRRGSYLKGGEKEEKKKKEERKREIVSPLLFSSFHREKRGERGVSGRGEGEKGPHFSFFSNTVELPKERLAWGRGKEKREGRRPIILPSPTRRQAGDERKTCSQ